MNNKALFIPSLGYVSVAISRHDGESLFVGGVGGASQAFLATYSVQCNSNRFFFSNFVLFYKVYIQKKML